MRFRKQSLSGQYNGKVILIEVSKDQVSNVIRQLIDKKGFILLTSEDNLIKTFRDGYFLRVVPVNKAWFIDIFSPYIREISGDRVMTFCNFLKKLHNN